MGTSWSAKLAAPLSPEITRGLKRAWNYRSAGIKNEKKCKAVPLVRPEHPFIAWFATDAAKNKRRASSAFIRYPAALSSSPCDIPAVSMIAFFASSGRKRNL